MGEYIVIEFGDAVYTEFRMKHGGFGQTEDAVVVGIVKADSKEEAIARAVRLPYCEGRVFETKFYDVKLENTFSIPTVEMNPRSV